MAQADTDGSGSILVTGATGFLGGLVAAAVLARTRDRVLLPLRNPDAADTVLEAIATELTADGHRFGPEERERVVFAPLPPLDRMDELVPALREHGVRDILHCAGCLSYFNTRRLQEGNIALTRALISAGKEVGLRRFVFLSTAYSSGFKNEEIVEALHSDPGYDPTEYTKTKREAEMIVAESGLPFVIVRPSIVIGHSGDGRYGGKHYGLYQLWSAFPRFLDGVYPEVLHVVAGRAPINFLHQDSFVSAFWEAYRGLPDGSAFHLVSGDEGLPTMRELWQLWMRNTGGPREIHFYDRLADVPQDEVDERLRMFLEFTSVNSEIASVHWRFDTGRLDRMLEEGLDFAHARLETVEVVQRRFMLDSERVQRYVREWRERGSSETKFISH